jgi:hypothetical protein
LYPAQFHLPVRFASLLYRFPYIELLIARLIHSLRI